MKEQGKTKKNLASISKVKIRSVLFLIAALALLIPFSNVQAQSKGDTFKKVAAPTGIPPAGINLSLSPTYVTLLTEPGKEISSEFRLRNNNPFAEHLKITLSKFTSSNSGRPVIADLEEHDEYASWFTTKETEFVMQPGQTKTIAFTVSPPADAALGYYYAIVVSRISDEQKKDSAVITGSVALPVLLDVRSKDAKRELQIVEFKTNKLFYEYLPAIFDVSFKNTGNIHVVPAGDIFIDSMFNKDVAVLQVNEGRGNVLPNGERDMSITWNEGFITRVPKTKDGITIKNKKGENEYETKYDFSKANEFRFGRYTAHLLVVYDNGERDIPMEATVSFWIIPWKIVGGVLLVVTFAVLGFIFMFKSLFRKVLKR